MGHKFDRGDERATFIADEHELVHLEADNNTSSAGGARNLIALHENQGFAPSVRVPSLRQNSS